MPSILACKEIIFNLVIYVTKLREKRKQFRDHPKDSQGRVFSVCITALGTPIS